MATRDEHGRRVVYMMPSYDLISEVGQRVIIRFFGEAPGVIAQCDLESPEDVDRFVHHLRQNQALCWPIDKAEEKDAT